MQRPRFVLARAVHGDTMTTSNFDTRSTCAALVLVCFKLYGTLIPIGNDGHRTLVRTRLAILRKVLVETFDRSRSRCVCHTKWAFGTKPRTRGKLFCVLVCVCVSSRGALLCPPACPVSWCALVCCCGVVFFCERPGGWPVTWRERRPTPRARVGRCPPIFLVARAPVSPTTSNWNRYGSTSRWDSDQRLREEVLRVELLRLV